MEMPAEPKDKKIDGYEKYEIEQACETLLKAEMIKNDAKFMKALQPYLNDKARAAKALASNKTGIDKLKEKISRDGY